MWFGTIVGKGNLDLDIREKIKTRTNSTFSRKIERLLNGQSKKKSRCNAFYEIQVFDGIYRYVGRDAIRNALHMCSEQLPKII